MSTKGFVTVEDHSGEKSTVSFWVQDVGATNYASVTQDVDEVKDAIIAFSLGEVRQAGFTKQYPESNAQVTDPTAQRERKALVIYKDTTAYIDDPTNTVANPGNGKLFQLEIPAPRLYEDDATTSCIVAGTDLYDLNSTAVQALIAGLEPNIRSPYNHTATAPTVSIQKIVHVGRNV